MNTIIKIAAASILCIWGGIAIMGIAGGCCNMVTQEECTRLIRQTEDRQQRVINVKSAELARLRAENKMWREFCGHESNRQNEGVDKFMSGVKKINSLFPNK